MPGADTHPRALRASGRKYARESSQVRRTTDIPCAMVYGVWRDLPGVRALIVPVTLRNVSQGLTSASGGQDHALWLVRRPRARLARHPRPSHPAAHVRDDRDTPLWRRRDAGRGS